MSWIVNAEERKQLQKADINYYIHLSLNIYGSQIFLNLNIYCSDMTLIIYLKDNNIAYTQDK